MSAVRNRMVVCMNKEASAEKIQEVRNRAIGSGMGVLEGKIKDRTIIICTSPSLSFEPKDSRDIKTFIGRDGLLPAVSWLRPASGEEEKSLEKLSRNMVISLVPTAGKIERDKLVSGFIAQLKDGYYCSKYKVARTTS